MIHCQGFLFNIMSKLALHYSDVITISNEIKIMLIKLLRYILQNPFLKQTVMSQYESEQNIFNVCCFLTCVYLFIVALGCNMAEGRILGQPLLMAEVVPEVSAFKVTKNVVRTFIHSFLKSTCSAAFKCSLLFIFLYH